MDKDTRDKIIIVIIFAIMLCGVKVFIDKMPLWLLSFMRELIVNF